MAKKQTRFTIERSGVVYVNDKKLIASDCTEIIFTNDGDTPVDIELINTPLAYRLNQGEFRSFGTDRSEVEETTSFKVTFQPLVTDRKILIERVNIVPLPGVADPETGEC